MFDKLFSKKNIQDAFWDWFKKNSDVIFHFERNQDFLFHNLKSELNKIHSDLVFEFSPILQDGKREFVISADGIKNVFPIVKDLVSKAPSLDKWHIVAFRQPRKGITQITYDDLIVNFEDVFFRFGKDNGQIALELNIRGFYEAPEWTGATFILLDNVLGEYYTEMSLSSIEKKLLNEDEIKNLYPILALPKIVQDYYSEWNN
jgi:hypothetical protein